MYSLSNKIGAGKRPKSQFHIVANSNVSSRQFKAWPEDEQKRYIQVMLKFGKFLRKKFRLLLKAPIESERSQVKLKNISLNIEVAPKSGLIHLDGNIFFDKYCLFDFEKLNTVWRKFITEAGGKSGIINLSFMPDYISNSKNYSKKDKMNLYDSDGSDNESSDDE